MSKVFCYPRQNKPTVYANDTWYFELFSVPEEHFNNVGYVGLSIIRELRNSKICPSTLAFDFLIIAYAVVAADKAILRKTSSDGWTREIELTVFVHEQDKWQAEKKKLEEMLRFLTGDFWTITFKKIIKSIVPVQQYPLHDNDCISLLSGGMDSLVGAIDLHEMGKKPLFVSQVVRGDAEHQRMYANSVGSNNLCQWSNNIKIHGTSENSTRARSILFFAYALVASCGIKCNGNEKKEIYVPENGFISLNIPLDSLRIGSLSTKTTHPVYMRSLQKIWDDLGMNVTLVLPYKYKTKGEVLIGCKNQALMKSLIFGSTSCGKYLRHGMRHCGTCVPCLVRRASFLKANMNDDTEKGYCTENLNASDSRDLAAAAIACIQMDSYGIESLVKGALSFASDDERAIYLGVIIRGLDEIRNLLKVQKVL